MHDPKPIKIAMIQQDMNAEDLADKAKVSRPTLTKILRGDEVLPQKLQSVLAALGLSMGDVFHKTESPESVAATQ